MSDELDELFGEQGGQPLPRRRLVLSLLIVGLTLATLGLGCSAAPGGLIVLAAWVVAEKELDRVETGYLSADLRPEVQRLHQASLAGVVVVLFLFVVQIFLFYAGFYEALLVGLLSTLLEATRA